MEIYIYIYDGIYDGDGGGGEIRPATSDEPLAVRQAGSAQTPDGEEIFYVSGVNDPETDAAIYLSEKGTLMFQPAGGKAKKWTMSSGAALGVLVLDNYSGAVVCMKSFNYTDSAFVLAS